ncbi:unnamed protein product, partial [Discosporangium mesarthrocarpum]
MASNDVDASSFCSRADSRRARDVITKDIFPLLKGDPEEALPPDCPLRPSLDMFLDQERHKISLARGRHDVYQCGYCSKRFRMEYYMDKHMDNKHPDKVNLQPQSKCLGDLCPVLGCKEEA